MKYLQILNAGLLLTGAIMALNLAVVCLLYAVHVESEPRLAADLPRLFAITGLFTGLALAAAAAFFGHRRQWPAHWVLQALPIVPVLGIMAFVIGLGR